jgi:hypothetical protein
MRKKNARRKRLRFRTARHRELMLEHHLLGDRKATSHREDAISMLLGQDDSCAVRLTCVIKVFNAYLFIWFSPTFL